MSYTVITTNRDRQAAVVVTSRLDVLSIAKAVDKHPDEAVTVFAEDGRWVSIDELEKQHGRAGREQDER